MCVRENERVRWQRSTRPGPSGGLREERDGGSVIVAVSQALTSPSRLRHAPTRRWTFITNHAQVLLAVAQTPNVRVKEIAAAVDITERYAYRILRDLQNAGYVGRRRST